MKLKFVYTLFLASLSAILFMSNSLGRAAGGGGNSTTSGCGGGGCHSGGSFKGNVKISIQKNGAEVTKYVPDEDYDVTVTIEKTAGGTAQYGFQLTATKSNKDAGTFSNVSPSNSVQISKLGTRTFVEHSIQMSTNVATMKWKAPAKGTGTVSFLAAGNIVNGANGNAGDSPITPIKLDLTEGSVSAQELPTWVSKMTINPNPIKESAILTITTTENKATQLQIFDMSGKLLQQSEHQLVSGENTIIMNTNDLAKGLYIVALRSGNEVSTKKIVKI